MPLFVYRIQDVILESISLTSPEQEKHKFKLTAHILFIKYTYYCCLDNYTIWNRLGYKMNIIKYHNVGTVPKSYKNAKSIPLTHKCVTAHLPGFGTGTSIKMAGLKCLQP